MRDLLMFGAMLAWVPLAFMNAFVAFLLWLFTTLLSPNLYLYGFMQSFRYVFFFAGLALVLALAKRLPKPGRFVWDGTAILMVVFVAHAMLSFLFGLQPNPYAINRVDPFLKGMALALMLPFFANSRWRIHAILLTLVLGLGIHGVVEGLKVAASGGGHNIVGISTGALNDNNLFALGMVMLLPIYLHLYKFSANRWVRWALLGGFVLTIFTVIGSNSRGGFLAMVVVGFWYWLTSQKKLLSLVLVAIVALGVLQVGSDRFFDRISTIKSAGEDYSFMTRVAAWRVNLAVGMGNPVFGGGFDAPFNRSVWNEYKDKPSPFTIDMDKFYPHAAHSIYFQVIGDLGLLGLIWFLALLASAFVARIRIKALAARAGPEWAWASDLSTALVLSLVAFMAGGAAVSLAYYELVYMIIMLVAVLHRLVAQAVKSKVAEAAKPKPPAHPALA